jgi:hypothetical protein
MMLRLKANYAWPAMYISAFMVDGLDVSAGLPADPIPGPNLVLAYAMGTVMGASHQEPMDRNKPEWDAYGKGAWDWTNNETISEFWRYGAERSKDMDVLYTMGMRGDGDMPLTGASLELVRVSLFLERGRCLSAYEKTSPGTSSISCATCTAMPRTFPRCGQCTRRWPSTLSME